MPVQNRNAARMRNWLSAIASVPPRDHDGADERGEEEHRHDLERAPGSRGRCVDAMLLVLPIGTSSSLSLISLPPYASTSSAVDHAEQEQATTTAAGQRWLLSRLAARCRIGARVSMMPNRNSMTMAPM